MASLFNTHMLADAGATWGGAIKKTKYIPKFMGPPFSDPVSAPGTNNWGGEWTLAVE